MNSPPLKIKEETGISEIEPSAFSKASVRIDYKVKGILKKVKSTDSLKKVQFKATTMFNQAE